MPDPFDALLAFLEDLDRLDVDYRVIHTFIDGITVITCKLEEYYEVTFYRNGTIETERFRSEKWIQGDAGPSEVIEWWTEPDETELKRKPRSRKKRAK